MLLLGCLRCRVLSGLSARDRRAGRSGGLRSHCGSGLRGGVLPDPVVMGELAEALLERGCRWVPTGAVSWASFFKVANLAHEKRLVVPLSAYVGVLSAATRVEGVVPPGCPLLGSVAGLGLSSAPLRQQFGDDISHLLGATTGRQGFADVLAQGDEVT